MAETRTPRFNLPQWSAGTDSPSRTDFSDAFAEIEARAVVGAQGTLAGRPAAGVAMRLYHATNVGRLFLDTGAVWLEVAMVGTGDTVPIGAELDYNGGTVPTGYLLEDNGSYAQASYPLLFAVVGTTHNQPGDPAGTFRVPDSRGRGTIGSGQGTGLTMRVLASLLGEESHVLITAETPSHTHTQNSHTHTQNSHFHSEAGGTGGGGDYDYAVRFGASVEGLVSGAGATGTKVTFTTSTNAATAVNQSTTPTNQNTGGGGAHNNMQPSRVVTKVIRAA